MQLRYQQHNGIAVVLVSNYATQYNRSLEISGQFFSVHDNYDLVLLSHFRNPKLFKVSKLMFKCYYHENLESSHIQPGAVFSFRIHCVKT